MSYNYDPELQSMLEFLPDTSVAFSDPPAAREGFLKLVAMLNTNVDHSGVTVENRLVPGPADTPDIPAWAHRPQSSSRNPLRTRQSRTTGSPW
jgi:hypothetical protein